VKLKLLSIYASRKDTKSFYVYALEVKGSSDEAAWAQAAEMGRALEPNNALYGSSDESPMAQVAPVEDSSAPAVDFDLGFGDESPQDSASSAESTVVMSASELLAAQEAPMDFDVTSTHSEVQAAVEEEPKSDVSAMDFDLTASTPVVAPAAPEEPSLDMAAMDFDLTTSTPSATEEESAPALNLDDLVFDVTSTHATPSAPVEPAPAFDADEGMAFTIDIPNDVKPEVAAKSSAPVMDVGLGEISLNLDAPVEPAAPEVSEPKGEQWHEVATKLDLAKAYQEMGDQDGAREILEEVVRDGDAVQRETAESLLQQLS
jgi:pilus assembly protein FimV